MAVVHLEEYVDIEHMADGTGKSLLEKAFASIDDDNAEYMCKYLKQDVEEYIAGHVSQELRNTSSVMRSICQEVAVLKIESVSADHKAMVASVPDIPPKNAQDMPAEEATALLKQLRTNSSHMFKDNLGVIMAGARASILQEKTFLADDAMKGMLEDMVLESKQNAYYQEMKKAIHGLQVPVPWQRVKPEDLKREEDKEQAIRLVSLTDEQMNKRVEKNLDKKVI